MSVHLKENQCPLAKKGKPGTFSLTKLSDEILSILERECKLFDEILTQTNPDFLIMLESTLHQQELFYKMCKKNGVKILLLNEPNISRCIISENPRKLDEEIDLDKIVSTNRNFRKSGL